jgi:hypothetical protein
MVLNFPIHKLIHPYAGIDIHLFQKDFQGNDLDGLSRILRCSTLFVGCGPSPYLAVRLYYLAGEFERGNPTLE